MSIKTDHHNLEELEMQAKQAANLLDEHAQRLSMRTIKQLEDGRARALDLHQKRQGDSVNADGTLSQWTSWLEQHRIAFVSMVVVAAIGSFLMIQNLQTNEVSDAFLLGADLPPEAFVDLGFEPALNQQASM